MVETESKLTMRYTIQQMPACIDKALNKHTKTNAYYMYMSLVGYRKNTGSFKLGLLVTVKREVLQYLTLAHNFHAAWK